MTRHFLGAIALLIALPACTPAPREARTEAPAPPCRELTDGQIDDLFKQWNDSLKGTAARVDENYQTDALLLPTLSALPRQTPASRQAYFHDDFLPKKPTGTITLTRKWKGCNFAINAGLYDFIYSGDPKPHHARFTFTYAPTGAGTWKITSHHSSVRP